MTPAADAVARFAGDLVSLGPVEGNLGLAVSGGPDSLALLLLAHAALGGRCRAATVDHRLRPEARSEAAGVASVCASMGVGHDTLTVDWTEVPTSNLQARAREQRYILLGQWARRHGVGAVLTAHHADDQAETLLMRLARGSGLSGLAGTRKRSSIGALIVLRPLLGWSRAELGEVVAAAGLDPVNDPSNRDPRFDRVRIREWLATADYLNPNRLAASASHLADAEEALRFVATELAAQRIRATADGLSIDAAGLPRELQRRLLVAGLAHMGESDLPGPEVDRLLTKLGHGGTATLGSSKLVGGSPWLLTRAPRHRQHC